MSERQIQSREEMMLFGQEIGDASPSIVALYGDLGAGKTTFVKGLAQAVARIPARAVSSPTFTLLNIYEGERTLYHFDLYRLKSAEEFIERGLEDYLSLGISCIEWPERIAHLLPPDTLHIEIAIEGEGRRVRIR
jgi:tRNA threonylcarbamoyladenosine biosynthesis protein TsaE